MTTDPRARSRALAQPDECREEGFSLVEVMLGTILIVVGLAGIMSSTVRLHSLQRLDTELGHAFRSCRSNLEELRSVPLGALPSLNGTGFDVLMPDGRSAGLDPVEGDPDSMPGEIHVTLDRSAAGRNLYRVRVVVKWTGASRVHKVELQTLRGGNP